MSGRVSCAISRETECVLCERDGIVYSGALELIVFGDAGLSGPNLTSGLLKRFREAAN